MRYTTIIKQFDKQGDKTGWTYIDIPAEIAEAINPGVRLGYRVKGKLDAHSIEGVSIMPMGDGSFIMALNAAIRKGIGKRKGASVTVDIVVDTKPYELDGELVACLEDVPEAAAAFYKMSRSNQNYYSKWVESAKTDATKAKRIAMAISGLAAGLDYGAMLRKARDDRKFE